MQYFIIYLWGFLKLEEYVTILNDCEVLQFILTLLKQLFTKSQIGGKKDEYYGPFP